MNEFWSSIKTWITKNHTSMIETLNPPAREIDFDKLELAMGLILPQDFKDFMSIHNGQTLTHLCLFDGDRLLSTEEILNEWNGWNAVLPEIDEYSMAISGDRALSTPDVGIKNDWWNHSWIPITSDRSGNNYCIDLDPTLEGRSGQIIRMWHDMPDRDLIATSFADWIAQFVFDLETGVYVFSDNLGIGGIVKKEL